MESKVVASIYAAVVNGAEKSESYYADVPGFSNMWDEIAADVEKIREAHPDARFDIPNEFPGADSFDQPRRI